METITNNQIENHILPANKYDIICYILRDNWNSIVNKNKNNNNILKLIDEAKLMKFNTRKIKCDMLYHFSENDICIIQNHKVYLSNYFAKMRLMNKKPPIKRNIKRQIQSLVNEKNGLESEKKLLQEEIDHYTLMKPLLYIALSSNKNHK